MILGEPIRKIEHGKARLTAGLHCSAIFFVLLVGAGRETRTPTVLPPADFESAASTDSAIPAMPINRHDIVYWLSAKKSTVLEFRKGFFNNRFQEINGTLILPEMVNK